MFLQYDIDLGPITLTDWHHRTAYQGAFCRRYFALPVMTKFLAAYAAERTGPPVPANFLIAGFVCTLLRLVRDR